MKIDGNHNIVIQGVEGSEINIQVDGISQKIANDLKALKELLEQLNTESFKFAKFAYNISEITEDNFDFVTRQRPFNQTLTKVLIEQIRMYHGEKIRGFFKGIDKSGDGWEKEAIHVTAARGHILEHFVWVIGEQLRRLYRIGNDSNRPDSNWKRHKTSHKK